MTASVEKIVEQARALPEREFAEFRSWLAEYERAQSDEWGGQIERDHGTRQSGNFRRA
jgi:hypothetical protein